MSDTGSRPLVCVQGLGFVGAAMSVAVADAVAPDGSARFDVIGVDLPTAEGRRRVEALNRGEFPFETIDRSLRSAAAAAHTRGNLSATSDPSAYERAAIAIVDVHLDVDTDNGQPTADMRSFRAAIRTLGERLPPGALVIVETTVPPGTTAKVVAPELEAALRARGLPASALLLAHSYERVMPGPEYLSSIKRFWRVYAGHTPDAADACHAFLTQVIETAAYPLSRLQSTTASETAKVLENSYRAVTIAFAEEWGRFAETVGIDLFEVIDAIRVRPTHSNMRQPGFGVGGYCLTKDPHFAGIAARELFDAPHLSFPFSSRAVAINAEMPLATVDRLAQRFGGALAGKRILLLGVSYRSDVADTRYSPSETFVREATARGARVTCHDPLVQHWEEMNLTLPAELPRPDDFDAVVFAVPHEAYRALDVRAWLGSASCAIVDANRVLPSQAIAALREAGHHVSVVGVGERS